MTFVGAVTQMLAIAPDRVFVEEFSQAKEKGFVQRAGSTQGKGKPVLGMAIVQ
jgi:hypothetical protein